MKAVIDSPDDDEPRYASFHRGSGDFSAGTVFFWNRSLRHGTLLNRSNGRLIWKLSFAHSRTGQCIFQLYAGRFQNERRFKMIVLKYVNLIGVIKMTKRRSESAIGRFKNRMRCFILLFLLGLVAFLSSGIVYADDERPIRLEIKVDKKIYMYRGSISLTITYKNESDKPVFLVAGGQSVGEGFPGETFEIQVGTKKKTYAVSAVDPLPQSFKTAPGKTWKRTIKELAPNLCDSGIEIDGKVQDPKDPLPDPFGIPGKYSLRVLYESTIKKDAKTILGKIKSNTVNFDVVTR